MNDVGLMKSRIYTSLLTVLLISGVHLSDVSAAPVPYKKKVHVQAFQNPPGWIGTYNPGDLISDLLREKLIHQENVALVSFNREGLSGNKKLYFAFKWG